MGNSAQNGLLALALVASIILAFVNHLLPPKAFSATQLLFDYNGGFLRRGLLGAGLNFYWGAKASIAEIRIVSAMVSALGAFAVLTYLAARAGRNTGALLLLILLANAFAFASFVGSAGYLDGVLVVLAVLAISLPARSWLGVVLRMVLVVVGMLVHENMLPFFSILIAFDLWLMRASDPVGTRLGAALAPVAAGIVGLSVLAVFGNTAGSAGPEYLAYLQGKTTFLLDPNSTAVAERSLAGNFDVMEEMRTTRRYWVWVLFDGVPLFLMGLWLLWLNLRLLGPSARLLDRLSVAAVIFAPLSLNIVAFDVVRFGSISVIAGFLCAGVLVARIETARDALNSALSWPVFAVVLVLNANMFTIQISEGAGHTSQFPWVLVQQMQWFQ